jgi:hypothetical protein
MSLNKQKQIIIYKYVSQDSAVCIGTGYGLDGRWVGLRASEGQDFSPLHVVQTGPGAQPRSYPMGTEAFF